MNKEKIKDNSHTEHEIRELQRQLAEISFLLALKKMEKDHPTLERFVSEIDKARNAIHRQGKKFSQLEQKYIGDISLSKSLQVFGRILAIGTLGYGLTVVLDWLLKKRNS